MDVDSVVDNVLMDARQQCIDYIAKHWSSIKSQGGFRGVDKEMMRRLSEDLDVSYRTLTNILWMLKLLLCLASSHVNVALVISEDVATVYALMQVMVVQVDIILDVVFHCSVLEADVPMKVWHQFIALFQHLLQANSPILYHHALYQPNHHQHLHLEQLQLPVMPIILVIKLTNHLTCPNVQFLLQLSLMHYFLLNQLLLHQPTVVVV